MKKRTFYTFTMLLVLTATVTGALTYKHSHYDEKQEFSKTIDTYLRESNYQQQILTREIMRDSKMGEYFAEVIFKDEPDNTYEIYEIGKGNFKVYGYKNGVEIINRNEAKYITYQE
ncbi:DUF3139 domain-containing protein [Exiguobacterium sp. SH5S4]|uniref:DUF3139 domain-containing protein n=1 Tax=Exiguobacterium sp. SH5S4 TaxID=2510961 RepID=UPI00103E86E8|nr:DUF3139 domain-containing protein [Exiguobacterium sp. SH5S4]TCI25401.1 DUF3139 domain-containing protein [Exiguobacterium sp. SH5S4]